MKVAGPGRISPELEVWTRDQCHEMHLKSLEILERTGVVVHDREALKVYRQGGAAVRGDKVFIPAWLVEAALRSAPERIVLRRGDKRVNLEEKVVSYGLGTDLPFFQDHETGTIREAVLQDVRDSALLTDYLPHLDYAASSAVAKDVTTRLADLHHFQALFEGTEKPLFMTATDRENLQGMIEMAAAGAGGYDALKRSPSFLLYVEPISPLINSTEALQKLMLAAEYEIPVTYASGITSGASGPVTLAGNLTLGNAEGLAGLVLHQLVNPGAPFMYGIVAAPLDMHTTICCYGGPEIPLYFCIVGEMGRYYNLPSFGQSGATDAAVVDQQAAIEALFSIFTAALSGTNLVHDNGYIGNGLVGSLEMMVLCDECISLVQSFMEGIEITPTTLALDLIERAGPEGGYSGIGDQLKGAGTWRPRYFNPDPHLTWREHKRTMGALIKEEVRYILKHHRPPGLTAHLAEEFKRIITEHEKRIAAESNY